MIYIYIYSQRGSCSHIALNIKHLRNHSPIHHWLHTHYINHEITTSTQFNHNVSPRRVVPPIQGVALHLQFLQRGVEPGNSDFLQTTTAASKTHTKKITVKHATGWHGTSMFSIHHDSHFYFVCCFAILCDNVFFKWFRHIMGQHHRFYYPIRSHPHDPWPSLAIATSRSSKVQLQTASALQLQVAERKAH